MPREASSGGLIRMMFCAVGGPRGLMPTSGPRYLEWPMHQYLTHPRKSRRESYESGRTGVLMLENWPAFPVFVRA